MKNRINDKEIDKNIYSNICDKLLHSVLYKIFNELDELIQIKILSRISDEYFEAKT